MSGVLLAHRHHGHPVAAALGRQVEVDDLRKSPPQDRHEHLVQGHAQHGRLVRRLAGVGRVIDRRAARRDPLDREHREALDLVVIAGVVAERPLERGFVTGVGRADLAAGVGRVRPDLPFEDDLGSGGHLQVAAQATDGLGAGAAQQAGELVLRQRVRHRRHCAEDRRRIGTEGHRNRKWLPRTGKPVVAEVQRSSAVGQPAHDQPVRADDLLAVDAEVLPLLVRSAGDHQTPGDQRPGVPRPARLDRQTAEVDVLAFPNDLLAGCRPDAPGGHVPQRRLQHRHLAQGVLQPARRLRLLQRRQQLADVAQCRHVLRPHAAGDPASRTEEICQHRHRAVRRLLEKQGGSSSAKRAVADLRHLEDRRYRHMHPSKVSVGFELGNEVAQVGVFHIICTLLSPSYRGRLGSIKTRRAGADWPAGHVQAATGPLEPGFHCRESRGPHVLLRCCIASNLAKPFGSSVLSRSRSNAGRAGHVEMACCRRGARAGGESIR